MLNPQVETVTTGADKAKLAAAVLLLIGALLAYYTLAKQGPVVQWAALLIMLAAALAAFFTSESGKSLIAYGRDSSREVRKVVWPTREEATRTTWVVIVVVILLSLILAGFDFTIQWAIEKFLNFGR